MKEEFVFKFIRAGHSIKCKWVKFGLRLLTLIIISTKPMSSPNIFKANSIQNSCPAGRISETRSALSPCCRGNDPSINRYRPFPVITKYKAVRSVSFAGVLIFTKLRRSKA